MDDNSLSIDLKKLRRNLPPPPIPVAPLNIARAEAPVPPQASAPTVAAMPSSTPRVAPTLPPKPRAKWLPRWIRMPKGTTRLPTFYYVLFAVLILLIMAGGYYIYVHFWTQSPFGPTSTTAAEAASIAATSTSQMSEADIVSAVGKLILLPTDETPTLAKVSDPAVLQSQVFFKNAVTGDVVLMYAKSLRAILYDPIQDKIIEVGPITAATSSEPTAK